MMMAGDNAAEESGALLRKPSRLGICFTEIKSGVQLVRNNCAVSISLASLFVTVCLIATAYGVKMSQEEGESSNPAAPYAYAAIGFAMLGIGAGMKACVSAQSAEVTSVFRWPPLHTVRSAPAHLGA